MPTLSSNVTLDLSEAVVILLSLLSLFSPTAAIGPIATVTAAASSAERRHIAFRVALLYFVIMAASLWVGHYVLKLLGIEPGALTATGGVALFISGLPLMSHGNKSEQAEHHIAATEGSDDWDSLAFVPLTFPLTIGGATVAFAVALSGRYSTLIDLLIMTGISALVAVSVWLTLMLAGGGQSKLKPVSMDLLTRVSGIILVSLSMQFLVSGLTELFATTEFAKHFIHGS